MNYLILDIETIPQDEAKLLANSPEFAAPVNIKDPEKIAASIAKKRADYINDAALNWKTAEVALVGYDNGFTSSNIQKFEHERVVMLSALSLIDRTISSGGIVGGHNIKGFDLPMLINRARVHRLSVPKSIITTWKGRPMWSENIFDTLEILSFGKSFEGNGMNDAAKALGIEHNKLGNGADFHKLWKEDIEAAIAYNKRDVEIEVEIAKICGCIE